MFVSRGEICRSPVEERTTGVDATDCKGHTAVAPTAADDAAAATVAARGGDGKNGNKGVGLSMLAKIKGRFARHTAARSGHVDRQKRGGEAEHDRAAG